MSNLHKIVAMTPQKMLNHDRQIPMKIGLSTRGAGDSAAPIRSLRVSPLASLFSVPESDVSGGSSLEQLFRESIMRWSEGTKGCSSSYESWWRCTFDKVIPRRLQFHVPPRISEWCRWGTMSCLSILIGQFILPAHQKRLDPPPRKHNSRYPASSPPNSVA